jgi:hypothetical protein
MAATRSSLPSSTETVALAPKRRAASSRSSGPPTVTIVPAPAMRAAAVAKMPSAPAPWITTVDPERMPPARSTARSTVLAAQPDMAAQVSLTSPGSSSLAAPGVT